MSCHPYRSMMAAKIINIRKELLRTLLVTPLNAYSFPCSYSYGVLQTIPQSTTDAPYKSVRISHGVLITPTALDNIQQ